MSKIIGFYHTTDEYGCLSNFYPCKFTVDGITFSSTEQYFHYAKARLFDDKDAMEKILKTNDPMAAKRIGRVVKNFNYDVWCSGRETHMRDGILAKFSQNDYLRKILLSTGSAILAECSPTDTIWGIGTSNPHEKWRGQNLLGKILMSVRTQLISGTRPSY